MLHPVVSVAGSLFQTPWVETKIIFEDEIT
jgi:hypothetical protein